MHRIVDVSRAYWLACGEKSDKPSWAYYIPWRECRIVHKIAEVRPTNDGRFVWYRKRPDRELLPELVRSGPPQGVCNTLDEAKTEALADIQETLTRLASDRKEGACESSS